MPRQRTEAAMVASLIRKELKEKFPNIKFNVRSENYTGGNSVNIEYTDEIPEAEIEKVVEKYKDGYFDGMTDMYEYKETEDNHPRAKYVFVRRNMSEEAKQKLIEKHNNEWCDEAKIESTEGYNNHLKDWNNTVIWREFCKATIIKENNEIKIMEVA